MENKEWISSWEDGLEDEERVNKNDLREKPDLHNSLANRIYPVKHIPVDQYLKEKQEP